MNKKYMVYSVAMMSLVACQPSFAMGGKMFKLARFVGVTTLPACGLYRANILDNDFQVPIDTEYMDPATEVVTTWGREKMKQLNISDAESTPFVCGHWASRVSKTGKGVMIDSEDEFLLADALINKPKLEKMRSQANAIQQNIGYDGQIINDHNILINRYDKIIARDAMILKHELGHIVNKDIENKKYVAASVPLGVEAISFGITSGFKKLYKINPPKKLMSAALRSSGAVGAIIPKALLNIALFIEFERYEESRADKFACKNAESRLELEQYAHAFGEQENPDWATKNRMKVRWLEGSNDLTHPCFADRREMVESYLVKWDAEHADNASARAIERS